MSTNRTKIDWAWYWAKSFLSRPHTGFSFHSNDPEDIRAMAALLRRAFRRSHAASDKHAGRTQEGLVAEIARELYDRFVMGGWEPQDAYPDIREWLARSQRSKEGR